MWMTLPVVLLGGVAWWFGRLPSRESPTVRPRRVRVVKAPTVLLRQVWVQNFAPRLTGRVSNRASCEVSIQIGYVHAPNQTLDLFLQKSDIVSEHGLSLLKSKRVPSLYFKTTGINGTTGTANINLFGSRQIKWLVNTQVIPTKFGAVYAQGSIASSPAKPISIRALVRPLWMVRGSKFLRLKSILWKPKPGGGQVKVELVCTRPQPVQVSSNQDYSALIRKIDPVKGIVEKSSGSQSLNPLLFNWSQRVEGVGRQYDRHIGAYFTTLGPRSIVVIYEVFQPRSVLLNPVFKAEIGLEDDGFIAVKCPLTFKSSGANR